MALELASRTMNSNVGSQGDKRVLIKPGKDPDEDDENSLCERISKVTLVTESKDSPESKIEVLHLNDVNKETNVNLESGNVLSFENKLEANKIESIRAELSNNFASKTNVLPVEKSNEITEGMNKLAATPREFDEDDESGASDDDVERQLQGRGPNNGIAVKKVPHLDPEVVGNYLSQLSPNSLAQQDCKVTEQARRNQQFLAGQSESSRKFRRPNDVQTAATEPQEPTTMQPTVMQQMYVHPSGTQAQVPPEIAAQYQMMQQAAMLSNLNQPIVMQSRTLQPATVQQGYFMPNSPQHYANHLLRNTTQQVLQSTTMQQRNHLYPATQQHYNFQSLNVTQTPQSVKIQPQIVPPVTTQQYYGAQLVNMVKQVPQSTTMSSQNYLPVMTQHASGRQPMNVPLDSVPLQSTHLQQQNNQPSMAQTYGAIPPMSMPHMAAHRTMNEPPFIPLITSQNNLPQTFIQNGPNCQNILPQSQASCGNSQTTSGNEFVISQAVQNISPQLNTYTTSQNKHDQESFASLPVDFDDSMFDELMHRTTDDDLNTIDLDSFNSLIEKLDQNDLPEFVPEVPRLEVTNPQESKQISNTNYHVSTLPSKSSSEYITLSQSPHSTTGHSPRSSNVPSRYSDHEQSTAYLSPSSVNSTTSRDSGYQEENNATNEMKSNAVSFNSTIPICVESFDFDFDNPATEGMYDESGRLIVKKPPRRGAGSRATKNKKQQVIAPCNGKQASVAGSGKKILTNGSCVTSNPFLAMNMNTATGNAEPQKVLHASAIRIPFVSAEQTHMMMTNFNFNQQQQLSGVVCPSQHQPGHVDNQRKKLQAINPRPTVPAPLLQQPGGAGLQSTTSLPQQQPDVKIYRQLAGMTTDKLIQADQDGDTILHIAISRGENKLVEALLDRLERADLLVKIMQTVNNNHQTPLFLAIMMNNALIARQLIDRGADVNEVVRKTNASESGLSHFRLLHYAAAKGSSFVSTLRELLKTPGIDVNARNSQGLSPLHISINSHGNRISSVNDGIIDSMPAIFLLAEHGANLNVPDGLNGKTPLHYIIEKKNAKLTNWFLELITHIYQMRVPGRISEDFSGGAPGGVPGGVPGSGVDILYSILTTRTSGGLTPVQLANFQQSPLAERSEVVQILLAAEARVEKLKSCRVNAMNRDIREEVVRIF